MNLFITEQPLESPNWRDFDEAALICEQLPSPVPRVKMAWVLTQTPHWQNQVMELSKRRIKTILMSREPCISELQQGFSLGARGYVELFASTQVLRQAFDAVQNDALWLPGKLLNNLIGALAIANNMSHSAPPDTLNALSRREQEVAQHVAAGESNKVIAERLFICERTVKQHLSSIYTKLNVKDRLALALVINKGESKHY